MPLLLSSRALSPLIYLNLKGQNLNLQELKWNLLAQEKSKQSWMQASEDAMRSLLLPLSLLFSVQGLFRGLSLHDSKDSQLLQAHSRPGNNLSERVSFPK